MKLSLNTLSAEHKYRLNVLARCLFAIFCGFGIANLAIAVFALPFQPRVGIAAATGFLSSFIIWLVYVLFVFSSKTLKRICIVSAAIVVFEILVIVVCKLWGMP